MNMNNMNKPLVLLHIEDLIFISKVSIAAKEAGIETRVISNTDFDDIENIVRKAELVIIDLDAENLKPFDLLSRIGNMHNDEVPQIVAFVSHLKQELIHRARQYKNVNVLSRSQFVEQLSGLFQGVKEQ